MVIMWPNRAHNNGLGMGGWGTGRDMKHNDDDDIKGKMNDIGWWLLGNKKHRRRCYETTKKLIECNLLQNTRYYA